MNKQENTQINRLIDKMFSPGTIIEDDIPVPNKGYEPISFKVISIDDEYTMKLQMLNDNYYYKKDQIVDYGLCMNEDGFGMYAWRYDALIEHHPCMYVYFEDEDRNDCISFGS